MASFFDNLFGGGAEREAAEKNRAEYAKYGQLGTQFLDTGLSRSVGALNDAKGNYGSLSDLAKKYGSGTDMRLNALGLNGAEGSAAARSAFTESPGYSFTLDQGLDALNRRRAAGGMLNSGNADIDALKFGTGLASGEWNTWLSNLADIDKQGLSATGAVASGKSGIDQLLASLYQTDATNRVGLQGNVASGNANANNFQAQGEANGAKNGFNALMGVASLAAGGLGGMGGLGSLGGAFGFGGGGAAGSALGSLGLTYGLPGTAGSNMYGPVR